MTILIYLLLTFQSFADMSGPCTYSDNFFEEHGEFYDSIEAILSNYKEKKFDAVSIEDLRNSYCRVSAPSNLEIENWLKEKKSNNPSKKETIAGLELEDSNELLKAFESLVVPKSMQYDSLIGESIEVEGIDVKNAYQIENCDKVLCAVKKIFGNEVGPKLLYMRMKYGLNGSNLANINSDPHTAKTLAPILDALSSMPQELFPIEDGKQLTLFSKGRKPKSYGDDNSTLANATINLFDGWRDLPKEEQDYTIIHELSHQIADVNDLSQSPTWLSFSNWEKTEEFSENGDSKTNWFSQKKQNIISRYGEVNPDEDFAESVSAYRYNAQRLKEVSPEKYEFIKNNVFFGQEFLTNRHCNTPSPLLSNVIHKAQNITPREFENLNLEKSLEDCSTEIRSQLITSDIEKDNLTKCFQVSAYAQFLNNNNALNLEEKSLQKFLQINANNLPKLSPQIMNRPLAQVAAAINRDYENLLKQNSFIDPNSGPSNFCNDIKSYSILSKENFKQLPGDLYDFEKLPDFQYRACQESFKAVENGTSPAFDFPNSVIKLLTLP